MILQILRDHVVLMCSTPWPCLIRFLIYLQCFEVLETARTAVIFTDLTSHCLKFLAQWKSCIYVSHIYIYIYIYIYITIYIYIYIPGFIKTGSKDAAVDHSPASILPRRIGQFGKDSVFRRSKTISKVGDIKT